MVIANISEAAPIAAAALAAAPPTQFGAPGSIWWVPIIAAVIGAIASQITPLIKDYILQIKTEERAKVSSQAAVFRNYAAPLSDSCEKLVWRFSEIFVNSRHQFLKMSTLPLVYNEYKRASTLYRIASLLGWLRAINLELSSLPRGGFGLTGPIQQAIIEVRSALADGPFVEIHRLERLSELWRLDISTLEDSRRRSLATRLEVELYRSAGGELKHDSEYLSKMSEERKVYVVTSMANLLCAELKRQKLDEEVIRETMHQAVQAISYREALVYRDWQDAIGDAMLELDQNSVRRYRVRGYADFENILGQAPVWFEIFKSSIDDIDFEEASPNDYRAKQLKDLAISVAKIVIELSVGPDRDLISTDLKKEAENIVKC